jgi:hypothetical protein
MAERHGVSWRRLLSEAVVIVASVYLAIVLEGMSEDRDRATEAVDALVQLVEELRKDRADLAEVIAEQENLSRQYVNLRRWFEEPSSMPTDSVQETLDLVAWSNRTMFPRGAAWTTMVAAGQLRYLDDVALVTRLGDLYENVNPRIEYNGAAYDENLMAVMRESVPTVWDFEASRLVTGDPEAVAMVQGQLRFLQLAFNGWYLWYLAQYAEQLDGLILDVEAYLDGRDGREGSTQGG